MSQRLPPLRRHRAKGRSDRAYVTVRGRRRYLGPFDSEEAKVAYAEVISRIAKGDDPFAAIFPPSDELLPTEERQQLTVSGLLSRFLDYARQHYRRRDGTPTGTAEAFGHAMKSLLTLYGGVPAANFDSLALMALQQHLVERGVSAAYINGIAGKIRRLYRWGAARKLVPHGAYELLRTVESVRAGYGGVPAKKKVQSVAHEIVEATLPHLSRVVAAMVRLQRHSGMRPREVCTLRPDDVDRSGEVWVYRPGSHKTEHHDQERRIHLGPKAQDVLRPFLLRDREAYCFDVSACESPRRRVAVLLWVETSSANKIGSLGGATV